MALVALAVSAALGLSILLGLEGAAALLPPAIALGCFVVWVIGLNVTDAVRQRRRARPAASTTQTPPGPTDPRPGVSEPPTGNDRSRPDTTLRRLLIIEAAFPIAGRGIVVSPALPSGSGTAAHGISGELRRPDGSASRVELQLVLEHVHGRLDTPEDAGRLCRLVCVLRGVAIDDVQPGCELWCPDDLVSGADAG